MIDESSTPGICEVIESIVDDILATRMGNQMASVVAYDETRQLARVQPLVMRVYLDDTGSRVATPRPQINDVPVLYFGGSGGAITCPIKVGDTVLLVACGVHIDRWQARGGIVDPGFVDPEKSGGRISDVIAISGLTDGSHLQARPNNAVVIHGSNKLGGPSGTQKTLMADSFLSALDTMLAAIGTAVGGIPGGAGAASAISTALTTVFAQPGTRAAYKTSNTEVK